MQERGHGGLREDMGLHSYALSPGPIDCWTLFQSKRINHIGSCSFVRQHTDVLDSWHKQLT